jgi:hypothetical protein
MTWPKAAPVIIAAAICDAFRLFFTMFWFFGPVMASVICTATASETVSTWTLGLGGVKTTAVVCAAVAGAAGTAGVEITGPFGVIMADAVGLATFLALGVWIIKTNARIFKAVASGSLWFVGGFAVGEIPFIGGLPTFSIALWRLYGTQIRVEGEGLQKLQREHASELAQDRRQQAVQRMQAQNMQIAQMQEQEAANEAIYEQAEQEKAEDVEAANDDRYSEAA